jgi:anti-sigma factor RsiW
MTKHRSKTWFRFAWHPSDEELLAFLDGELSAKPASKVQKHLEGCWACRAKREKMERSISAFINYRNASLADTAEAPPRARKRFADKLSRLAAEQTEQPQLFRRYEALVREFSYSRPAVWATAVVLLAIGLGVRFGWDRQVSARELLQRTTQAEANQLNQVSNPVLHRKFQVRRRSTVAAPEQVVNWEIWSDRTNRRFAQRAINDTGTQGSITQSSFSEASSIIEKTRIQQPASVPEVMLELERILQTNQMDGGGPVSASSFQTWRQSIPQRTEKVSETRLADGEDALMLTTVVAGAVPESGITEAELVVRAKDWHPVVQRLRVNAERGEREYEITELDFQVVSLGALDAAVFADRATATLPPVPAPSLSPTPTPVASLPSPVASAGLEVEVLERLNQANALLGEQVTLTRTSEGKLVVEGIVETDARKREILEALKTVGGNPAVKLEVGTVAEAQARRAQSEPRKVTVQDAQVAQQTIPVETELRNYFSTARGLSGERLEQEIQRFSSQICSRSSRARSHALALKQIAERFTPAQLQTLDQATRSRFSALLVEHAQGYGSELEKLRQQLQPIFPLASSGTAAAKDKITGDEDLIRAINRLFELAATNDEALCLSFSLSTDAVKEVVVRKQEFWRSVGVAESLAAQVAGRQ